MGEKITRSALNNIFDQFRAVGFYPAPFLVLTDALVGEAVPCQTCSLQGEVSHTPISCRTEG